MLPAKGSVSSAERKSATIEIRTQLRKHGYRLAVQRDVRKVVARAETKTQSRDRLETIARGVQAVLVLEPVVETSSSGTVLQIVALDLGDGAQKGVECDLPRPGPDGLTRDQIRPATAACVAALLGAEPISKYDPLPPVTALELNESDSSRPAEDLDLPEDESKWGRWDHTGFFIDGGFALAWCLGDGLCSGANPGYGGRLKAGYRFSSIMAVYLSGVVAAHEVPRSDRIEKVVLTESAFVWSGVYVGFRYHPAKRFFVDPFVGFDMGWTWMVYKESRPMGEQFEDGIPAELLPSDLASYLNKQTTLVADGFSVVPQIGLRFFFSPNIAIGTSVEWFLVYWRDVCATVQEPGARGIAYSGKECTSITEIQKTEHVDVEIKEKLTERSDWPKFFSLQFELVGVF
ncbi:MAG: porin family protein [Deltaproteobacteria bacterium]|nr:porin family protein [Deltaproteobacteria bacterium]